jgi:subtilisin family serine protease
VSTSTPLPSLAKDVQYNTPTPQDVNQLVNEVHSSLITKKENLFLIYFDNTFNFEEFIDVNPTKMIFKGLRGVIIQGTTSRIAEIIEENEFLSDENVHPVYSSNTKKVTRSNSDKIDFNRYSIQTALTADKIGVSDLWNLGYKGQNATIGIFDTGVNSSHSDFYFPNGTSRVIAEECFIKTQYGNDENQSHEPESHGTGVAGFAAGGGIQNPSYIGMAPESLILSADLDNSEGTNMEFTSLGEIAAINWAIENGVDVINKSYGPELDEGYLAIYYEPYERMMLATLQQATKQGVIFTHSAGNAGSGGYTIDPTNYIHEISVGATDDTGSIRASYSSTGPVYGTNSVGPDVVAPGGSDGIVTTAVNGGYFTTTGTSQSAPHVAGAVAVLLSAMRDQGLDVNPGTIKAALMNSAYSVGISEDPWSYGAGQINASAAYELLMSTQKIRNHPIVGATNPRNLSIYEPGNYPDFLFPNILVGTISNNYHMSFVSSESTNVSITSSGNISTILSFSEQVLANFSSTMKFVQNELDDGILSDYYSHDIVFNIAVPEGTPIGLYTGDIVFKVNATEILRKPFSINVKQSEKKILFYTGNAIDISHTTFRDFSDFTFTLSQGNITVNEEKKELTANILADYDVLWIAAGNRTYQDYSYIPTTGGLLPSTENTIFTETEQELVLEFVDNGGGVILTPYSTPLGCEVLINQWGISTSEIPENIGYAPATLWHANSIGSTFDFVDPSGSFYSTEGFATSLAYQNTRNKVVMASYDDPSGGRVVVMSGSNFISNMRFLSTSTEGIYNDRVAAEIIDWVSNDDQLFGGYQLNGDIMTFYLHASNNGVLNNTADIFGSKKDMITNSQEDMRDLIPISGTNGWYNFTYTLEDQGIDMFNFTWNSEIIAFEIITDSIPPKINFSRLENNSLIEKNTEILFWFYDSESGVNKHEAKLTIDENPIGFYGPLENKTGNGYYIEKMLLIENYGLGKHELILSIEDLAGNTASLKIVFTVTPPVITTASKKSPGLEWNFFIVLGILSLIVTRKRLFKENL